MKLDLDRIRQAAAKKPMKSGSSKGAHQRKKRNVAEAPKPIDVSQPVNIPILVSSAESDQDDVALASVFLELSWASQVPQFFRPRSFEQLIQEDPLLASVAQTNVPIPTQADKRKWPQEVEGGSEGSHPQGLLWRRDWWKTSR